MYRIDCKACPAKYIGQTKNYLRDRINTHKRSIIKGSHETALSKHAINELHAFDFENTKIIDHESNNKKRIFKEMIYIKTTHNKINNNEDTQGFNTLYNAVL